MIKKVTELLVNEDWYDELNLGEINKVEAVSGGDINLAFKITTVAGQYFLKVQPKNDQSFFDHEVEGLNLINSVVNAPKVIKTGTFDNDGYLLMNYVDFGSGSQFELGKMVAHLHQKHAPKFGLDHDVLNAKNIKINTRQDNWGEFFVHQRLDVLVDQVKTKVYWNDYRAELMQKFEQKVLHYYQINPVTPSLLHGDLWNGNVGFQSNQQPILFDPDVFFGDREMDIAMTMLFGGFSNQFYQGYNSVYPLRKYWESRIPWYQSYYLLAHLNLFGETYGSSLESALQQSIDD